MLLGSSFKKIFITGGAGFIGSHVVDKLLSQGYEVTAYDNLSNGREKFIEQNFKNKKFKFIEDSILNFENLSNAMKGHDFVWHLAANTDIIGGFEKPRRDLEDCTIGTFNVLNSMNENRIKPMIFSSTGATYGDLCKDEPKDESAGPLLPISNYAAGKIGSEAFISAFCSMYDLRAWIYRFGNVIGSRMTHGVIVDFIDRLKKNPNQLTIFGNGKQEKNYFLVEECINGMAYGVKNIKLDSNKPCDIFNLGSESITKVIDIANMVKEEMKLHDAEILIEGSEKAWPGDQPKVYISENKMKNYCWKTNFSSDSAVREAIKRMLKDEG